MNLPRILIFVLIIGFGLITLLMSAFVIFDLFDVREMEGNYVPFIVWINFICSFFYLIAAYGYWFKKRWTYIVLAINVILLLIGLISLFIYIYTGGIYESKTVYAMIFRVALTLLILVYIRMEFRKRLFKNYSL